MDLDGNELILKNSLKKGSVEDDFHRAYAYYNCERIIKIMHEIIKR